MFTWKDHYLENEQREDQISQASQDWLLAASLFMSSWLVALRSGPFVA